MADEKLLYRAFEKAGFRNIHIEKVKLTFKFDTAEQYTKFTQDIAAPVNAMLKNQSKERTEQIWDTITQEVSKYTNIRTDSGDKQGPVSFNNKAICIVCNR